MTHRTGQRNLFVAEICLNGFLGKSHNNSPMRLVLVVGLLRVLQSSKYDLLYLLALQV